MDTTYTKPSQPVSPFATLTLTIPKRTHPLKSFVGWFHRAYLSGSIGSSVKIFGGLWAFMHLMLVLSAIWVSR